MSEGPVPYWKTAKGKAAQARFKRSPKGKAIQARYDKSEKGVARRDRANSTVSRVASNQRYYATDKGRSALRRYNAKRPSGGARAAVARAEFAAGIQSVDRRHAVHDVERVAVLSDLQIPFEDPAAVELALRFVEDYKPDLIILNGDIADCHDLSDYDRDPRSVGRLTLEIRKTRDLLTRLSFIRRRIWIGGNHEDRWRRVIWRESQRRAGMGEIVKAMCEGAAIDPDNIDETFRFAFSTKHHRFDYWPYGHYVELAQGNLIVTHGFMTRLHSGAAAKAHYERLGRSCIIGHTHKLGDYQVRKMDDRHGAWENGCLCSLKPEWVQFPNWQHGFSIIAVAGKTFHVTQIPILSNYSIQYGGKTWTVDPHNVVPLGAKKI